MRSGATLYVTAIGFVGKLDLNSGRFAWKNAELARPGGMYTYFDRPRIEGGRVVFAGKPQDPANPFPDESKVLLVDDRTGAILSGAPPPLAD